MRAALRAVSHPAGGGRDGGGRFGRDPKDYHAETQVMIQLMSHDEDVMPDAMAGLAASAAIQLSDFPFECAISEVRVGRVDGNFIINPTRAQLELSDIDMVIGASADSVMMVEGEMNEISEEEMTEAIKFAHEAIKAQIDAQHRLAEKVGRKEVREYKMPEENEELAKKVRDLAYDKAYTIAKSSSSKSLFLSSCFFRSCSNSLR